MAVLHLISWIKQEPLKKLEYYIGRVKSLIITYNIRSVFFLNLKAKKFYLISVFFEEK